MNDTARAAHLKTLVRRYFAAYLTADRAVMEAALASDFHFTSPYDDHIDRAAYFERCWPNAGSFEFLEIREIVVDGNKCFVLYDGKVKDGSALRNTELLRFQGEQLSAVEVYFGRPASAPAGMSR